MIIETFECDLINTAHVVRATRLKSSEKYEKDISTERFRFELSNGEQVIGHIPEEWMQTMFGQTIPAAPGFYLIGPHFEEDTKLYAGFWKTPVIAWTITRYGATPVTVEGTERHGPILCPDGGVEDPYDRSFETIEEWENAERENATQAAERLKTKPAA